MSDTTPPITFFRERFASEFVKEIDRLAADAMFDRALATHDAEVRAEAWDVGAKAMMRAIGDDQTLSFIAPHNPYRGEARAGFVSEEPNWEWGVARERFSSSPAYYQRDRESCERFIANPPIGTPDPRGPWFIMRRRRAGAWTRAEREGEQR